MVYISGLSRNQILLFPETLNDYITEGNLVRFIDAFVERTVPNGMSQIFGVSSNTYALQHHRNE